MAALAELNELKGAKAQLEAIRFANPAFYIELMMLFQMTGRMNIKNGYVCQMIMDVEIDDRYMGNLHNKHAIDQAVWRIRTGYPVEYIQFRSFLRGNKMIGYNNIVSMLLGDTPQAIKGNGRANV
ncbi:hypothetical protein [Paenibacillus puerhi]|uniref:hypothetical protein n=1 Tax=Paenibacillus puerhi TaxID=2692622 RepID=UPI00135C24FB|nr:hypothetical protein [Paenibacillus puerhi]